jgi:hypothetical protein
MHTGTLGKTSRGRRQQKKLLQYEKPRPAAQGGGLPDGVLVFSSHGGLRQPEPNGGSDAVKKCLPAAAEAFAPAHKRRRFQQKKRTGTSARPPEFRRGGLACGESG